FESLVSGPLREKVMQARKAEDEEHKRLQSLKKVEEDGILRVETPTLRPTLAATPTDFRSSSFLTVESAVETRSFDSRDQDEEELTDADILSHPIALAELSKHLICAALVGIEDPLRPGVPEAVEACKKAGIFVRMVTGDNVVTAKSIATKCGIYTRGGLVMEGSYFRQMGPEEMAEKLPRLQVLARSSPTDKQILVANLKALGETVAVTGDGTNDGPALKMADIGFSMGIAGTEVAKEASSIILMDDSFSSVVKATMWGRSVNDSVKKFLQFQLAVNVSAVSISFISAVVDAGESSVLTAVQLLWVNLIMDTLAALALATERPTDELLQRPPESKKAPLITLTMWKMIIGQAFFQVVINLALLFGGAKLFGLSELDKAGGILAASDDSINAIALEQKAVLKTIVFNTFVMMQVFNEVNCRRIDNKLDVISGIHRNPYFMSIFFGVIGIQAIIVEF
ncbi:plasma membrane calcium, partial [Chytridiales sp. JEL 0842]